MQKLSSFLSLTEREEREDTDKQAHANARQADG